MQLKLTWALSAIIVVLTALIAGCGSSKETSAASSTASDTQLDAALEWTQCMREQGVDIPDPIREPGGMVRIGPRPGQAVPPAAFMERAGKACEKHLPDGGPANAPSPQDQAAMEAQALRFARCMRKHGIDFPDPQVGPSGGGISVGIDPEQVATPAFQKAQTACGSPFGPGGAPTG